MENYLMHSGRLGQKWGIMNGPPYPLSRGQLSAKQRKLGTVSPSAKEKYGDEQNQPKQESKPRVRVVEGQSGNLYTLRKAQDVYRDKESLTNQEIQEYLNRVNLERQLKTLADNEYASEHKFQTWMNKQKDRLVEKALDNMVNAATNKIKEVFDDSMSDLLGTTKTYKTKSPKEVAANLENMSDKEVQDWLKRYNSEKNIRKMAEEG